jgi:hypothetical protein
MPVAATARRTAAMILRVRFMAQPKKLAVGVLVFIGLGPNEAKKRQKQAERCDPETHDGVSAITRSPLP